MVIVETIGRVRREHFVKGKTIKEIARDLKISRNTVRKILRSEETSFSYDREVQPRPKLEHWSSELDRLLTTNAAKPARERLTLIRIFEELRRLGYEGGYDAVRRYARKWQREHLAITADAYVPLSFASGEAYQFDSHGRHWVKSFYGHLANSFARLFRCPWSEPNCVTRPVSNAGSNSHPVAALNGCTNIPRALRRWLRRTRPFWSSAFKAKSNFGSSTRIRQD